MKIVELGEVCEVIAGQSPPSSTYNVDGIGLPFFQGRADFQEKYPQVRNWCSEPKKISEPFDILFSVRAPVGSVNINNVTACIGRGIAAIRCGDKINLDYLFHFLRSQEKKIADLGTGSTFKAITIRVLRSIKIPLPPLPVQEKIASILDDAAALRDKTEQLLIEYDLLAQSIFLEMFGDPVINRKGWEEERLKNLGTLKSGGTPSRKKEGYFKGDIPWITTVALGERMIGYNNAVEYITKEAINNSATKLIPKGSIMIGVRVGVGKASLIECDMCSNQDIISLIDIDKKINKIFLLDVLFYFQKYFDSQKRGATIQGIKSSTIKELSVIVPPLNLQNQFAEKVQLIERQKEIVRQELKESEDLFQALLQKAFKGELV